MTDTFNVTGSWSQNNYSQGQTMKATIAGNDVLTQQQVVNAGPVTIGIVAADGAKANLTFVAVPVTITVATPESVVIDTSVPIVDNGSTPRTWVVSADKLSISAVA